MKSRPASSAIRASARQSSQLADQRSGTLVAERPDEQLAPNSPIFSALALYIARRSRIEGAGRSSKGKLRRFGLASSLDVSPPERSFHLAANLHRGVVGIIPDVGPFQALAFGDVALELHVLRETEREITLVERAFGRRLLAPDAEAALAVQHFGFLQGLLGGRD